MSKIIPAFASREAPCSGARVVIVCSIVAAAALSAGNVSAQELRPNLKPLSASSVSIENVTINGVARKRLRFSTTSWNNGAGPLELIGTDQITSSPNSPSGYAQAVVQRVYSSGGTYTDYNAGDFTYHPTHNHIHFDDYAVYTVQPFDAPGGSVRTGNKMTFCVMDTTKINTTLAGAPGSAQYTSCNSIKQGMSVGWGDTYGYYLDGQYVDITGNPDGIYKLTIEIDQKKLIRELDDTDNVSCALVRITGNTVTVLNPTACYSVASISPNILPVGQTVSVTISGYGITASMPVSFESGNGPRPVASDVRETGIAGTITATVTVPLKKNLGRDPMWDLRVGSGVLANAFAVAR